MNGLYVGSLLHTAILPAISMLQPPDSNNVNNYEGTACNLNSSSCMLAKARNRNLYTLEAYQ